MTDETPLDLAHAAMEAAPENDAARLRFYERLADAELFPYADWGTEAAGRADLAGAVRDAGSAPLCWSSTARSGWRNLRAGRCLMRRCRAGCICQMLAGQGIGLGLNLEVATICHADPGRGHVDWLVTRHSANTPAGDRGATAPRSQRPHVPTGGAVVSGLDRQACDCIGIGGVLPIWPRCTYDGRCAQGHVLAFIDAVPRRRQQALALQGSQRGADLFRHRGRGDGRGLLRG